MGETKCCDRCGRAMPGVEKVAGTGYALDTSRIALRRDGNAEYCVCPSCGAKYLVAGLPHGDRPSPATMTYNLGLWSDSSLAGTAGTNQRSGGPSQRAESAAPKERGV